ncbi:MAG: ABC transporter permease [Oscillospiraceae bacterium]|nr:ABC transporter permease [Oscillospiraceae bacterium]
MLLRKLFRTAWKYRAQFVSMIIMTALGIGIFLGFNIEWKSIESNTDSFFEATNYADFRIYSETGFSAENNTAILDIDGVYAASRVFSVNVDIVGEKKALNLTVSENYTVTTMDIISGAEYSADRSGIWLSQKFAEANNLNIGDTVKLTYGGIKISEEIVGLAKSGEHMICVADVNQLMPDHTAFGFAFMSPEELKSVLGFEFYPQINIRSELEKFELEQKISDALGKTVLVTSKDEHTAYAGAQSETEEGQTMGSILPVLFLAIAVLTMVTTMHRITASEKTQIGTLKALGFRDKKILLHYTSYGLFIGVMGTAFGIALGYGVAAVIMNENGMMGTYFDLPEWRLVMPGFCVPLIIIMVLLLTLISFLSVKSMLKGTAADALRPYTPKVLKKSIIERAPLWHRLRFGTRWNFRDIMRHKSRSAMTLVGIIGCMTLLVGAMGMSDTMKEFLRVIDEDVLNYSTRVNLSDTCSNEDALSLAHELNGDWVASSGVSLDGKTVALEIYSAENGLIGFIDEENKLLYIKDDGVYLCQRLADTANIGEYITISPYGSNDKYEVKVAGYYRSVITESVVMTDKYAKEIGIPYHIGAIFTDRDIDDIEASSIITGKQDKRGMMESYDSFMGIMNVMVAVLVLAAVILGIVVLYNLGVMSYLERSRELATLKVLGFRDKQIGRLLISQNVWLTAVGVVIGLPAGFWVLWYLCKALATEYELKVCVGVPTYIISLLVTFGVSLFVGVIVSGKNKKIDMVEALKGAE